jgi:hypothetical protein
VTTLAVPEIDSPPLVRFGLPELVYGASPAAGASFQWTFSHADAVRLVSVFFKLTPDATVANRTPYIEFLDQAGSRFALSGAPVTVPASDVTDFYFSAWRTYADWEVDSTVIAPLERTLLLRGQSWKISATNLQAADTITAVRFVYERFFLTSGLPGA